jgi:hypothetical protein
MEETSRLEGTFDVLAAKEILIKATAQAIPTYTMACFDLSKSLCDDISLMVCHYLVVTK